MNGMATLVGYRCDNCETPHYDDHLGATGWMEVVYHREDGGLLNRHFCTAECLAKWARILR